MRANLHVPLPACRNAGHHFLCGKGVRAAVTPEPEIKPEIEPAASQPGIQRVQPSDKNDSSHHEAGRSRAE